MVSVDMGVCEVRATRFHPFWVLKGPELAARPAIGEVDMSEDVGGALTGRWVSASNLREGDVLFLRASGTATVRRVSTCEERVTVCNLTVDGLHSFCVGDAQVLVHNTTGGPSGAPTQVPGPGPFGTLPRYGDYVPPGPLGPPPPITPPTAPYFGPGPFRYRPGETIGGTTLWMSLADWNRIFPGRPYPAAWRGGPPPNPIPPDWPTVEF